MGSSFFRHKQASEKNHQPSESYLDSCLVSKNPKTLKPARNEELAMITTWSKRSHFYQFIHSSISLIFIGTS
jgi:hypothetical protein